VRNAQGDIAVNNIFSVRLDAQSRHKLQQLAEISFRSCGGVIRYLIQYASLHQDLLPSEVEIPDDVTNPNETRWNNQDGLKGGTV
jgi:hypothetical protein